LPRRRSDVRSRPGGCRRVQASARPPGCSRSAS
jgi:hypothetical protein